MFVVGRYKLLLEDLLEHTPRDHHDYSQLQGKWQEAAFFFLIPGESVSGGGGGGGSGGGKWNLFKFIYFSKLCVIWFVVSIVELTSTMHKPTNSQSQLFLHLLQRPRNRRETLPSTSTSTSDSTRTSRRCCPFRKSLTAPLPRSCNLGASSWRRESWKRYQAQSSSQGVFGWNWHCCCCCCWSLLYSAILRSRADSLRSHVSLHIMWIAFYSAFLTIHQSGVFTALAWLVPHETAAVSVRSVYTIQPCTMSLHAKPHT